MDELYDLYESKRNLEEQIDNFFDDDETPYYGDRGYQDLLERRDAIQEQIDELEEEN